MRFATKTAPSAATPRKPYWSLDGRAWISPDAVGLHLSADDTERWAERPGESWPCSTLAGHALYAGLDSGGLVELVIFDDDGKPIDCPDVDCRELDAIIADYLRTELSCDHPIYFVAVGQFDGAPA